MVDAPGLGGAHHRAGGDFEIEGVVGQPGQEQRVVVAVAGDRKATVFGNRQPVRTVVVAHVPDLLPKDGAGGLTPCIARRRRRSLITAFVALHDTVAAAGGLRARRRHVVIIIVVVIIVVRCTRCRAVVEGGGRAVVIVVIVIVVIVIVVIVARRSGAARSSAGCFVLDARSGEAIARERAVASPAVAAVVRKAAIAGGLTGPRLTLGVALALEGLGTACVTGEAHQQRHYDRFAAPHPEFMLAQDLAPNSTHRR